MRKISKLSCLSMGVFALWGCGSIQHFVAKDYPAYLRRKPPAASPSLPFKVVYTMGDALGAQAYRFGPVDSAHVWVVQLGKILPEFLAAKGLQPAGTSPQASGSPPADLLIFDVNQYVIMDGTVHAVLSVRQMRGGKEILYKHYGGDGGTVVDAMDLTGIMYGTTRSVLRSTTVALDAIYGQVVRDLNSEARP
jgi:hypothetical protein